LLAAALVLAASCVPDDGGGGNGETGRVSGTLKPFGARERGSVPMPRGLLPTTRPTVKPLAMPRLPGGSFVPGEALVKLRDSAMPDDVLARRVAFALQRAARTGGHVSAAHRRVRFDVQGATRAEREAETLDAVSRLQALPWLEYAEPNGIAREKLVPGDRYYRFQWHYPAMNLPAAWDITTGSPDVVVAVVDSGIAADHPDFAGRLAAGYDMIDDPENAADGDGRDANPNDEGKNRANGSSSWHGTHVAGTIGAATDNNADVAGVDWKCKVVPIRGLGREGGTYADISAGIRWAAGLEVPGVPQNANPADVINLSLGGPGPSQTQQDAVNAAVGAGAIVVAAAGNENEDAAGSVPASLQNVVTVGATRPNGRRASYSNFGAAVDVMAPGGEIADDFNGDEIPDGVISLARDQEDPPHPDIDIKEGTSMAAPHVAGLLALMRAVAPQLTPAQAEAILKSTASADSKCSEGCGAGLVNALAAVREAKGTPPPAQPRLALGATQVSLGSTLGEGSVTVTNVGGGQLAWTAKLDGAAKAALAISGAASGSLNAGASATVRFTVNRGGVADGNHTASVVFESNGGDAALAVLFSKGTPGANIPTLYVLALDENGTPRAQADTDAAREFKWALDVAPGSYYIFAGSDDDNNDLICDQGEYCGAFRSLDDPLLVEVSAGGAVTADFSVKPFGEAPKPGAAAVGEPCPGGYKDCASGLCYTDPTGTLRTCTDYCPPTGNATCPSATTACGEANDGAGGTVHVCVASIRKVGDPCDVHGRCATLACALDGFPGGYCTKDCTDDGTCPTGSFCAGDTDAAACFAICGPTKPCRSAEGYTCEDIGAEAVCLPP
jgi:serine protease